MLGGHVRAHAHVGQQVQALEQVLGRGQRTGDRQPAGAEAAGAVGLRQAREGEAQDVVAGRARRVDVLAVVDDLLVDLVGEDDEPVLAGQLDDAPHRLPAVDGAGRIVRVDEHDRLRARSDPRGDVRRIRVPAVRLVRQVVHRPAPAQGHLGGPQRVVGGGDEHLVIDVQQGLQDDRDELAHAVAEHDLVDVDVEALGLVVVRHGGAGRVDPARVRVALRLGQVGDHRAHHRAGRLEAEGGEVADVELEDALPGGLHALRLDHVPAPHVVAHAAQSGGLVVCGHRSILVSRNGLRSTLIRPATDEIA